METRKVLVADPSPEFCSVLADLLGHSLQLRACHDGFKALEQLEQFHPDVLVADLTLPGLDGLAVLQSAMCTVPRPACLVTTRFFSRYIDTAIESLGVDYVVMKPCDLRALSERILDLAQCAEDMPPPAADDPVKDILMILSVPANRQGFHCLEVAIGVYLQKPGLSMTKELYPTVAKNYKGSASSVERSIRSVIAQAWTVRDEKVWRLYFQPDRNGHVPRPTNSRFIANVAEHLRCSYDEQMR